MHRNIVVQQAGPEHSERVGHLVYELLNELYPEQDYEPDPFIRAAQGLLASKEGVWAFLATESRGQDVGLVTLNECAAIYAGGRFG